MNNVQKKYFIGLTHFLGNVLGPKYEVVFHSFDKNKAHMEAIANSHVSGRTLSSPLSSFGSSLLQDKVYLDKDFVFNYKAVADSEKVIRGQTENALKGKCTGGTGTIGYKIDEEKFYRIDPLVAPFVLEAFQRYDNGEKIVEILNYLNEKGVRNMLGGKLTCSSMNTMLKNRRYIGELSFRDTVVPDAIPAIVPKDLFDRVQKRLEKNKRAPARGKADEEYLLTTKLFCGKCGALMFGESGTSATGRTYYYYKCATAKRRKGCNKKTVQKDWLESLVVQETMKLIQDDAMIERIVQLVMDFQNQENTTIPLLEKQLREVDRKLDNLMKAIEEGLFLSLIHI